VDDFTGRTFLHACFHPSSPVCMQPGSPALLPSSRASIPSVGFFILPYLLRLIVMFWSPNPSSLVMFQLRLIFEDLFFGTPLQWQVWRVENLSSSRPLMECRMRRDRFPHSSRCLVNVTLTPLDSSLGTSPPSLI